MISLAEIDRMASYFKVPIDTIEKDYIISWILACLSESKLKNNFIFYGGTAIKRIYFEDHRFSEDIDLISADRLEKDYILQELGVLENAHRKANINLVIEPDSVQEMNQRLQLYVKYTGFDEIIGAPKKVRLDFSMRRDQYGDVIEKEILKSYSDLKFHNETLSVMTLNTILANKLGLLPDITRNEPRDLFDIWFLLKRTEAFDFSATKIRDIFREKYGYYPQMNILIPKLQNSALRAHWNTRLSHQIANLPDINIVIREVTERLTQLQLFDKEF